MPDKFRGKSASATLNPNNQNIENLQYVVSRILDLAGCGHCGRLAIPNLEFLGDPAELGSRGFATGSNEI